MQYEIDNENYKIKISGTTDEIRDWIKSLCQTITGSACPSQLDEVLDRLYDIRSQKEFNFNKYERIIYDANTLLYIPNISASARKFYFDELIKKHFEDARALL